MVTPRCIKELEEMLNFILLADRMAIESTISSLTFDDAILMPQFLPCFPAEISIRTFYTAAQKTS
jgi:hypothetical protein